MYLYLRVISFDLWHRIHMAHNVFDQHLCTFIFDKMLYDTGCVVHIYVVDTYLWSIYFAFLFEGVIYGTGCVWSTPLPTDDLAHHIAHPGGTDHHSLPHCAPVCFAKQYSIVWQNLVQCVRVWYKMIQCALCYNTVCYVLPSTVRGEGLHIPPGKVY